MMLFYKIKVKKVKKSKNNLRSLWNSLWLFCWCFADKLNKIDDEEQIIIQELFLFCNT